MTTRRRRVLAATAIVATGLVATACGSQGIDSSALTDKPNVQRGAVLFADRCSGCHTLDIVGAQGGATRVHDRERPDGPNFNIRRETSDSVLYAIRNGGFSGAIMPENIVVGRDADDVAAFLSKYAGGERQGNDITPASQPAAGGNTTSTQQQTTSTRQQTTSTQQQTTSTQQQTTSTPEAGTTSTGTGGTQQASAQGKQLFTQNCAGCHTLKDAGSTAQVGPDLDQLKPDEPTVERQVTNGGGGMPAFKSILKAPEIKAVSQYVASVAGK
jgi:mono/diheme cytochrome c family protein